MLRREDAIVLGRMSTIRGKCPLTYSLINPQLTGGKMRLDLFWNS